MVSSMSVTEITRVATEVARAEAPGLEVIGVSHAGGDGTYAEVLLRVRGCHKEPCQVSLGVFRDVSESDLRAEIGQKLRRHSEERRPGD